LVTEALLLVQPIKNHENDRNGVGIGHKQTRKEEEFEVSRSSSIYKRILIVDDEPDIAMTLKLGLESSNDRSDDSDKKIKFEVYSYTDPVEALSNFKPNFYDLLLVDITMPLMNGFELCEKVLLYDVNIRVCFMTAGEINQEAIRELYPLRTIGGCFIKKPVEIDHLIRQLTAELE
jgi:CheY-like chemotaxis protein